MCYRYWKQHNVAPKARSVNGILLLDKPKGITSNRALQQVKRLFKAKKAGHSGSLDPLATGLLPICFGEATKFCRFLLESDKRYQVAVLLGVKTDTGDSEGEVVEQKPVDVSLVDIQKALAHFKETTSQIPSMYSALKHQGQPLYKLARQGVNVTREPRSIRIFSLDLIGLSGNTLTLETQVSKGTYIRTLADDIGEYLGCGAHVVALRRLESGPYKAPNMVSISTLENLAAQDDWEALDSLLLPMETALDSMPCLNLSGSTAFYLQQGQPVLVPHAPTQGWVKLQLNEKFLGVGEILDDGKVAPKRLLSTAS